MNSFSTAPIIHSVLASRCSPELADRCVVSIEHEIHDLDMNPIYMDCKIKFKLGQDEYPIIEALLRGEPEKDDIMKEIKTRVEAFLVQSNTIGDSRIALDDAVIEAMLNAGFKSL